MCSCLPVYRCLCAYLPWLPDYRCSFYLFFTFIFYADVLVKHFISPQGVFTISHSDSSMELHAERIWTYSIKYTYPLPRPMTTYCSAGPRHPTYHLVLDGVGMDASITLTGESTNRRVSPNTTQTHSAIIALLQK